MQIDTNLTLSCEDSSFATIHALVFVLIKRFCSIETKAKASYLEQ